MEGASGQQKKVQSNGRNGDERYFNERRGERGAQDQIEEGEERKLWKLRCFILNANI